MTWDNTIKQFRLPPCIVQDCNCSEWVIMWSPWSSHHTKALFSSLKQPSIALRYTVQSVVCTAANETGYHALKPHRCFEHL
jgi:hypothetical protein